ncbi:MAG: hypothetical protein JSV56_01070 [Methanomassiliicoccales archaeon]|nr:MAG: hypothetical protein JSV56_01070 [Methanomassiliicoccales archaeon]
MVLMKGEDIEEDFVRSLLVTLGYLALFSLFIFIPLIGFIIAMTLGAYVAGYRGGKYSVEWRKVPILSAAIWSTIIAVLVIFVIIPILPTDYDLFIGGWEIAIICVPYALNIIFCTLGARAKFKEKAVYI